MSQIKAQKTTVSPSDYFIHSWKVSRLPPSGFFDGIDEIDISQDKKGQWCAVLCVDSGDVRDKVYGIGEPTVEKSKKEGTHSWRLIIGQLAFTVLVADSADSADSFKVLTAKGETVGMPGGAEEPAVAGTWGSEDAPPNGFWERERLALVARAS